MRSADAVFNLRVRLKLPPMPDSLILDVQRPGASLDDAYEAAINPIRVPVSDLDDEQVAAVCKQWAESFAAHCREKRSAAKL